MPWIALFCRGPGHDHAANGEGGAQHDGPMPFGTRVIVEEQAYGVGTIDTYNGALIGSNSYSIIFDGWVAKFLGRM
eukprot:COSAG02_NODE_4151_length_5709_cov_21.395187_1_plen_76_part_00